MYMWYKSRWELQMLNDKQSIVDPITGEINIKFNPLPISEDYFIPSPDNDESPSINTLSSESDLEYLFNKYLQTVKDGKPNIRLANQVKLVIDCIQIKTMVEDSRTLINDPHATNRKIFKIPVGDFNEVESKSLIQKLKDKLKKK